jgi:hypothetical protein
MISVCKHLITSEWLDRFLWNLVLTLCHQRLLRTHILKILLSEIPTLRMLRVMRWNHDDAITHDPMCMRTPHLTYQTEPNLTSSQVTSVCLHFITREWPIFFKFGIAVIPFETFPNFYFQSSSTRLHQRDGTQIREVGGWTSAMTPNHHPRLRLITPSPVMTTISWSYKPFVLQFVSGLATQHNALNCYVATVSSE